MSLQYPIADQMGQLLGVVRNAAQLVASVAVGFFGVTGHQNRQLGLHLECKRAFKGRPEGETKTEEEEKRKRRGPEQRSDTCPTIP